MQRASTGPEAGWPTGVSFGLEGGRVIFCLWSCFLSALGDDTTRSLPFSLTLASPFLFPSSPPPVPGCRASGAACEITAHSLVHIAGRTAAFYLSVVPSNAFPPNGSHRPRPRSRTRRPGGGRRHGGESDGWRCVAGTNCGCSGGPSDGARRQRVVCVFSRVVASAAPLPPASPAPPARLDPPSPRLVVDATVWLTRGEDARGEAHKQGKHAGPRRRNRRPAHR